MFFDKWSYRLRILQLEGTFLPHESTWFNRLSRFIDWNSQDRLVKLDDYVRWLSSRGFASFRQELGCILRFIHEFHEISYFTRRFLFRLQEISLIRRRKQILPTKVMIFELLKKLNVVERLFILLMASTGRRAVDILHLKSVNIRKLEEGYAVTLEKDKMNSSQFVFKFSWDSTLLSNFKTADACLQKLLYLEKRPFKSVSVQKLRRKADFHLHGLRNRRSLFLVRDKFSVEEVKSLIGWSCTDSFLRYTKLNLSDIRSFKTLDSLILFINSQ